MHGVEFSVDQEIADCAKLAERVREEARDAMMTAQFRDLARKRLNEEGRDVDDPDALGLAVARERKVWIRTRLTDLGVERAAWWGWPNIYTYTKSLGEQLVAAETAMVRSIVRPSIVESAQVYPFPGWNEGFTTTAPIIFLVRKGQIQIPANEKLILDITPVDQVASVMLAVAAQACVEEPRLVYQAATGDSNPNNMARIIGLGWPGQAAPLCREVNRNQDSQSRGRADGTKTRFHFNLRKDFGSDVQFGRQKGFVLVGSRATALGWRQSG